MYKKNPQSKTLFSQLYARIGKRNSEKLLAEFQNKEHLSPKISLSLVLAFTIATLTHLMTIMMFILGTLIILFGNFSVPSIVLGACLLLTGWFLFPKMEKFPKKVALREDFPTLFQTVFAISEKLQTQPVDAIILDRNFNASFGTAGWKRKKVLTLGLPLISILSPQEFVALLGHELAHDINGDPMRGRYIGTAIDSLSRWHALFMPSRMGYIRRGCVAAFTNYIANTLMAIFSVVPWLMAYFLSHLLWRASQRAEYLADYLSSEVGGKQATLSLLRKLYFHPTFVNVVKKSTLLEKPRPFFEFFKDEVANMPEENYARLVAMAQKEVEEFGTMHPPLPYRVKVMEGRSDTSPGFILSSAQYEAILQETEKLHGKIQKELTEQYERYIS